MSKIVIESDGRTSSTIVKVDGKVVEDLISVKFEAKMKKELAELTLVHVYPDVVTTDKVEAAVEETL